VRKLFQTCAHLVQFPLNRVTRGPRQRIECFGERGRPNLKRSRHRLFCLAGCILPGRNFGAGSVKLSFDLVGQLKPVLEVIVNPFADRFDFGAR
jgi:hypothetical protein